MTLALFRTLPRLLPFLLALAACQSGSKTPASSWAPSAEPDRINLTWSDDPTSTQSITWRTDTSCGEGLVEYAVAEGGPSFLTKRRKAKARTETFEDASGARAHYHSITLTGLTPETRYVYRVGSGPSASAKTFLRGSEPGWSEWSHFTTASMTPKPFSFLYFGDAQNAVKAHWSRVVREGFRDAPRAAFMLHAGDLINSANRDNEWGEWFYASGWIARTLPSIATPGNHEYAPRIKGGPRMLSRHWRPSFTLPQNGPAGFEETAYYMDFQGMRLVSLDTNRDLAPQIEWFDKIMRDCDAKWTIVTMHHPMWSTAKGRDNKRRRAKLLPVFDRHKIDLVLQGHDHTYGRSTRMRHHHDGEAHTHEAGDKNVPTGVQARSDESGTVYCVSVSGPKMYSLNPSIAMQRTAANTQLYQVLSIDGDQLDYRAFTAVGKLHDRFTLVKRAGQPNELIEHEIGQ